MAVTGYLAEFSLPELFQFLDQGHKTGLLTINGLSVDRNRNSQSHYIWVHEGRIVAAAASLDEKGLLSMISQRGWLSDRVVSRLAQVFSNKTPMGLCLKSHGLLEAEQLKVLFKSQVLRRVCALFQLQDGQFEFQTKVPLPLAEMTGLSVPATEATLMSLRALRDWTALKDKLPAPTSGLTSVITGQPRFRLDALEWQVWEFAKGTVSLEAIAQQLRLPVEKVQQAAFRLSVLSLAEEVPLIAPSRAQLKDNSVLAVPELIQESVSKGSISQSFLQNLVSFLRSKV